MTEFLEIPSDRRHTTFPIDKSRQPIWDLYKKASNAHWLADEIDMSADYRQYSKLDAKIRIMIDNILAFFAQFDELVNINIIEILSKQVPMFEAQYFYRFQVAIEDVHAEVYSALLDSLIIDNEYKQQLFNSVKTVPIIMKMAQFLENANPTRTADILLRQALVEGVFFMAPFCCIYWLRTQPIPLQGLCTSNEFISRDENMHADGATIIYSYLHPASKLSCDEVYQIVDEGIALAKEFAHYIIPEPMPGLNASFICDYIEQICDVLLSKFNYPAKFHTIADIPFMNRMHKPTKEQMHEKRLTNYSKSGGAKSNTLNTTDDF